ITFHASPADCGGGSWTGVSWAGLGVTRQAANTRGIRSALGRRDMGPSVNCVRAISKAVRSIGLNACILRRTLFDNRNTDTIGRSAKIRVAREERQTQPNG